MNDVGVGPELRTKAICAERLEPDLPKLTTTRTVKDNDGAKSQDEQDKQHLGCCNSEGEHRPQCRVMVEHRQLIETKIRKYTRSGDEKKLRKY